MKTATPRVYRSAEEWQPHLQACQSAGTTMTDYAKAPELNVKSPGNSNRRLKQRPGATAPKESVTFTQVVVSTALRLGGYHIRLPDGVPIECDHGGVLQPLSGCIQTLRSARCARPANEVPIVYLCAKAIDFRAGMHSLSVMVEAQLGLDPFSTHLFVFRNRRRTSITSRQSSHAATVRPTLRLHYKRRRSHLKFSILGLNSGVHRTDHFSMQLHSMQTTTWPETCGR